MTVDLIKDFDTAALAKLAKQIEELRLAFGPAEGFQTAFRTLTTNAGVRLLCDLCSVIYSEATGAVT